MSVLNAVLRAAVSGVLSPFRGLSPWVGLAVVSILTAVPMLLVFRATSNQTALAAVKKQIHAGLFEIRLSMTICGRSCGRRPTSCART